MAVFVVFSRAKHMQCTFHFHSMSVTLTPTEINGWFGETYMYDWYAWVILCYSLWTVQTINFHWHV